jgi:hypothetical protein
MMRLRFISMTFCPTSRLVHSSFLPQCQHEDSLNNRKAYISGFRFLSLANVVPFSWAILLHVSPDATVYVFSSEPESELDSFDESDFVHLESVAFLASLSFVGFGGSAVEVGVPPELPDFPQSPFGGRVLLFPLSTLLPGLGYSTLTPSSFLQVFVRPSALATNISG